MGVQSAGSCLVEQNWRFANAEGSGAENTAYAVNGHVFVTNTEANTVDVLSLCDPTAPKHEFSIPVPDGFEVRDIDFHGSTLAVALAASAVNESSLVAFHDAMTGETIGQVEVGFGADEIQFSPNGTQLALANSGEPDFSDPAMPIDPPGSISLIDLSGGLVNASVQGVDFTQFDGHESELRAEGIRLRPDATSSADLAPEGIAFAPHGELWAALQQNNALTAISIDKGGLEIERLIPLGAKDHSLPAILWSGNFLQQCLLKGVSKRSCCQSNKSEVNRSRYVGDLQREVSAPHIG